VHRQAFARADGEGGGGSEPVEVGLVRALRADPGWVAALSLVAEHPEHPGTGAVIGHMVATEGSIGDTTVLGLGPVGVLPEHQGGVGSALMHAVLGAADAFGCPAVALLGHTADYPRFGFVPAAALGDVNRQSDHGATSWMQPEFASGSGVAATATMRSASGPFPAHLRTAPTSAPGAVVSGAGRAPEESTSQRPVRWCGARWVA
jgi:putative acetyltransferase